MIGWERLNRISVIKKRFKHSLNKNFCNKRGLITMTNTDFKSNNYYKTHKEIWKKYYEEHKKEIQEYNKNWRKDNKELLKNWRDNNKDKIKAYNNKNNGFYLYKIVDNAENVLYIGQTTNIRRRIANHLCFNSNIAEFMKEEEWETIYYLDVSNFVFNSKDLRDLETALINYYKPLWNTQILKKEEEEKEILIDTLINNVDWNIYTIKK